MNLPRNSTIHEELEDEVSSVRSLRQGTPNIASKPSNQSPSPNKFVRLFEKWNSPSKTRFLAARMRRTRQYSEGDYAEFTTSLVAMGNDSNGNRCKIIEPCILKDRGEQSTFPISICNY